MSRYIDADYLLSALNMFNDKEHGNENFLNGIETAKEIVENAPTAEPKKGKWEIYLADHTGVFECSECGQVIDLVFIPQPYRYCPNCGAKMERGDNT